MAACGSMHSSSYSTTGLGRHATNGAASLSINNNNNSKDDVVAASDDDSNAAAEDKQFLKV